MGNKPIDEIKQQPVQNKTNQKIAERTASHLKVAKISI